MDKDIFIKSDIFEDFNRETNQTVKNLNKGIDNASNGIDTILGTIQDFIIEKWDKRHLIWMIVNFSSQLLFGSLVVLCIAFLAMICCCLCPSSCCAFSVLKSVGRDFPELIILELNTWIDRFAVAKGHAVVLAMRREILEHHRNTVVTSQCK